MQPYLLMSLLYLSLVALSWLASIVTGLAIIPLFGSLKWLRVHLVTIGALAEITFGLLPTLVAAARKLPRPKMCWDILSGYPIAKPIRQKSKMPLEMGLSCDYLQNLT